MNVRVRSYNSADQEPVVAFALRAWAPVFASLQAALGAGIFDRVHPNWHAGQERAVRAVLLDSATHVWVAEAVAGPVGFAAAKVVDAEKRIGKLSVLAVDPAAQGDGIGVALSEVATEWMRKMGMLVGIIDTGGDPGHAPARRVYEKTGYMLLPITHYFKALWEPMRRVVVLGRGGAGKSVFARRLGELTALPVTELDRIFWSADLQPTPRDRWEGVQRQLVTADAWILDGDLGPQDSIEPRLAAADTVVVLDFGLLRCAWRELRRSPERSDFWWWVVRWRGVHRRRVLAAITRWAPSAQLHVLRTPREADRFLAGVSSSR